LTAEEAAVDVVDAGQKVVTDWAPHREAADVNSNFRDWNGGTCAGATYGAGMVAAELYHREPEALGEDDQGYTDWEWVGKKDAPKVLQDGIEAIVERIADAMVARREEILAAAVDDNA
jgi:hypothetical protein